MSAPAIPSVVTTNMSVAKLTATIGAEISGAELGEIARSDALFAQIKALLLEHKVLFFRDQPISRAEHVALARRFGPLEDHPVVPSDPDCPGLVRIYKDLDSAPEHYENGYHCDGTWKQIPPMGAVLRCVETPPVGGDTVWVNMVRAYEDLPEHIKGQIEPLRARHSIEATFGAVLSVERRLQLKETYPDAEHPVVRTHPVTGERILYVSGFATHFVNFHTPANVRYGFDYAPGGSQLLNYLIGRAAIPEYQVRWRWTKDSFAIWDNRSTQHYAVQDYWPAVRKMERAGILGEPF